MLRFHLLSILAVFFSIFPLFAESLLLFAIAQGKGAGNERRKRGATWKMNRIRMVIVVGRTTRKNAQ